METRDGMTPASLLTRFEETFDRWLCGFSASSPTPEMVRYHYGIGEAEPRRGKRIRPRMLLAVANEELSAGAGVIDAQAALSDAISAACAIEILHNYSLVHDDIEDGDHLRHGRETVWAKFGVAQGINAGDAMSAQSYLSILRPGRTSDPRIAARLAACLLEANLAMCWGQGLDIGFENADMVSYAQYIEMIEGKTAALFGAACALGATAANAGDERVAAYDRLGRAYGRAFQIHDDVLGIWGDPARTGKPAGADIRRRKWSFPVVWTLENAAPHDAAHIAAVYGRRPPFDEAVVARAVAVLEKAGTREAAIAAAAAELNDADSEAERLQIDRNRTLRTLLRENLLRTA